MHLATYIGLLEAGERTLATSYRQVADGHSDEADVHYTCLQLARQCDEHVEALGPVVERYGNAPEDEPERLHAEGLSETRSGGLGLLRDLHELYMLASYVDITWTLVGQAAQGARDATSSTSSLGAMTRPAPDGRGCGPGSSRPRPRPSWSPGDRSHTRKGVRDDEEPARGTTGGVAAWAIP